MDSDDEGDSDDLYDEDDEDVEGELGNAKLAGAVNNGDKKKEDRDYRPPRKLDPDSSGGNVSISGAEDSMNTSDSKLNTSKRQRKEKKIFDL